MQSHELIRRVLSQYGAKQVSDRVGLSLQRLYQWAEPAQPQGSGTPNPLDRVVALLVATGDVRLVEWLCTQAGGVFVANQSRNGDKGEHHLMACSNDLMEQYGDMIKVLATTARDGRITKAEAEELRLNWEKIKSTTEWYVRQCESGMFHPPVEK